MGSEIFILKTPEAHISTSIAPIASKIVAIDFYAQFMSKKNLLSFFWRLLPPCSYYYSLNSWSFCMIFSAFGSDCIRADSVELTAATVSASKKIRRAKSFPSEKPRRFGAPNLFAKRKLFPTVTHSFMVRFAWFLVCRKRLYVCRCCELQIWDLVTHSVL